MSSDDVCSFQPAQSKGGFWTITIGTLIGGLLCAVFIPMAIIASDATLITLSAVLISCIFILFCIVSYGYFRMEYIVTVHHLILRWGLFKTVIPFTSIASIGKPNSTSFDGIRTGGVGLPDHLYGAFRLLIDGSYKPIKLVATKLTSLVIIVTTGGKYYGITPANPDDFISTVKQKAHVAVEKPFDNTQRLSQPGSTNRKYQRLTNALLLVVFIEVGINIAFLLVVFPRLPDIVPVHYNIAGVADRFGDKGELVWASLFPVILQIGIAILLYTTTRRKSQLQQSVYGALIMLLPVAIGIIFLVLNIVLITPLAT